jgi:hypothetical protein
MSSTPANTAGRINLLLVSKRADAASTPKLIVLSHDQETSQTDCKKMAGAIKKMRKMSMLIFVCAPPLGVA